jgi:hypothetical protein
MAYPTLSEHDDELLGEPVPVLRQLDGFELALSTLTRLGVVFALGLALILTLARPG